MSLGSKTWLLAVLVVVVLIVDMMLVDSDRVFSGRRRQNRRRQSSRRRTTTSSPRTIVTNTTHYGESNVCKVCTTATFQCNETYITYCKTNDTDQVNSGGKFDRGKRHADHSDPDHSHDDGKRWNEWSNGHKHLRNTTGRPQGHRGNRCFKTESKVCKESKCDIRCCDGSPKEIGTNSCKSRKNSDGTLNGCMNGGTLNGRRTHCMCPKDFIGLQCQHRKCQRVCQNGGQCKTNTTTARGRLEDTTHNDDYCVCPSGVTGDFCENKRCDKECQNNGTCVVFSRWWSRCVCPPGFSGRQCENKAKEGECPARGDMGDSGCNMYYMRQYECWHDKDCTGTKKCCRNVCYENKCVEPASPNVTCNYNNETYDVGSVFSPDPCRVCTCNESHVGLLQGAIECTRLMCPQIPPQCRNVTKPADSCCQLCADDMSSKMCGDNYYEPYFVNCPVELVVLDVEKNSNVAKLNMTLIAKDCEGKQMRVTLSANRFQAGQGEENYQLMSASSAFDGRGNFAECLFHVRVRDLEPPQFLTCPLDLVESANIPASWPVPVAKDNVGLKTAPTSVRHPGQHLPPGEYMIEYWAEDYEGNTARCSFVVTVMDPNQQHHHADKHQHNPDDHDHNHDYDYNYDHEPHHSHSSHGVLNVSVSVGAIVFVALLVVAGFLYYRRFKRVQGAAQGSGSGSVSVSPTVRMSSVSDTPGWGGSASLENPPPRYGVSPGEIMSPPMYSRTDDMMASGGALPEAGELPAKGPLP